MSTKLYVGNLSFKTTDQDLQDLFAQAGTVQSINIITDRDTGFSRGFGFIEMSSPEEGAAAIQQFNGKEIDGRGLTVNEAKPAKSVAAEAAETAEAVAVGLAAAIVAAIRIKQTR